MNQQYYTYPKKLALLLLASVGFAMNICGQSTFKVLHYTETSGFDHQTRNNSLSMFQSFPMLSITNDNNGSEFNNLTTLLSYDLIVFSNTSGDQILDSTQRSHFEQYIQNGGSLLGIHAASDTYRHSSANGNSTGSWDFYANTLGGSLQQNPNHVVGTPAYDVYKVGQHPTTDSIPDPWLKNEEYYYWENGFLDSNIQIILKVEETVGPNNIVNSYDSSRAVSWCKELTSGSRIFYTSMGHANSNYTSDTLFQHHIKHASYWCLRMITSLRKEQVTKENPFEIYPVPAKNTINIESEGLFKAECIQIKDLSGKMHYEKQNQKLPFRANVELLENGVYILIVEKDGQLFQRKFIKEY